MADNNIIDDKTLKKQEESNALLEKHLSINQKLKEKKKELESILKSIKLYEEETLSLIDKGTIKGDKQINNRQKDLDILLKQRDTIKKELSSAKEREKSYKRMNDIHSGMKSVSSEILRDAKEETN
jgi:predicted glutamine amidotransferase